MKSRILIGCSSPPDQGAGGILSYTRELIECLVAEGVEIHLASPTPQDWSWCQKQGLIHIPTEPQADPLQTARHLYSVLQKTGFTGIINNDNPLVQSLFPLSHCPAITVGHLGRSIIASLACHQPQWSDYVVAIAEDMAERYISHYRVPTEKCVLIHNGVTDPGPPTATSRDSQMPLRVVFAGGDLRRKGADKIQRSVFNYTARWQGMQLEWFGDLPEKKQHEIAALGFVHYHGKKPREDFLEILKTADVLLFPSRIEGCPMALLEAMSRSVVPIVSDGMGAMAQMVKQGSNGYLCPLKDWPDNATQYLQLLQQQPRTLATMKKQTREHYLQHFQSYQVARQLLELLDKPTVNRSKPPRQAKILQWHRPIGAPSHKLSWQERQWNRLCYRFGLLHRAGILCTDGI